MMIDKPPSPQPSLSERFAANQQKNAWQQTIITAVVVLVVVVALVSYGVPDVKGDSGGILFGLIALAMLYLIFIRKRKQDVDADVLTRMLQWEWKSGNLGTAVWDQLDFSLANVLIEQVSDDFWLISCDNQYGGTRTLAIRGNDARSLHVGGVYNGDAATTRKMLEKNDFVRSAVAKGHTLREIEALAEKLGR